MRDALGDVVARLAQVDVAEDGRDGRHLRGERVQRQHERHGVVHARVRVHHHARHLGL